MSAAPLTQDHPVQAIHNVIETVKSLISVMSREVDLLRSMRVKEMGELQEQKLALVTAYEKGTALLRSDPSYVQHLDPLLKSELRDVVKQLNSMVRENESALLAAKASNERLMKAVVTAVQQKKAQDSSSYSKAGVIAAQSQSSSTPMQINQCL